MRLRAALLAAAAFMPAAFAAESEPLKPSGEEADKPALFQADRLVYENDGSTVRLIGNVEIWSDGRLLTADEVIYERASGRVTARGHVVIREADGGTLTADEVELTGDLKDGVVANIGIIVDDHTRLAAARATREGGTRTTLEGAVFSPCEVCAEKPDPLWQIKAVKIVWDQEAKRVTYEDASFEVFGATLLTVPAFSHADFTVKNQTGFLAPSLGSSGDLGYFVETPFHWSLDPSYDLTLAPMFTTKVNPVLKAEWRQRTENGSYFLSGSYTYDDAYDDLGNLTGGDSSYGHVFGRGRFRVGETMGWGFDVERTSSDTYLKRYEISDADRLTSDLFWEWRSGRSYASVTAYAFQGLRASDDPGGLVERFRKLSGAAVMLGSRRYWQGIDVRGDDLQAVVIEKLPFEVPTELRRRRDLRLRARGEDPFQRAALGHMLLHLKQMVGRLIRSETDRGVVVIVDARQGRGYFKRLVDALPEGVRVEHATLADLDRIADDLGLGT